MLRRVFFAVFAVQASLAMLVGTAMSGLLPLADLTPAAASRGSVLGAVLLAVSVLHLPLGWLLGRSAIRADGRRTALSGTVTAAVLLSVPAWFGMLLLASGERSGYGLGIVAVVVLSGGLGVPIAQLAARCATAAEPEPEGTAGPEPAHGPDPEATGRTGALGAVEEEPVTSNAAREERLP